MCLDDTKLSTSKLIEPLLKVCIEKNFDLDFNAKMVYTLISQDYSRYFKQFKDSLMITGNKCGKKDDLKRMSEITGFIIEKMTEYFITNLPDYNNYKSLFKTENLAL